VNFSLETIGLEGILKLAKDKSKGCEFRECLAYMDHTLTEPKYFTAHIRGQLANDIRGSMQKHLWSELGLIFIPDGSSKTLGEMTYNEHQEWRKILREKNSLGNQLYNWISAYKK